MLALVAALVSEAAIDGLRERTLPEQAAAVVALLALPPLFLIRGGGSLALLRWIVASAALTAVVAFGTRYAQRVPRWTAPLAAALGVIVATAAR
jgi:Flp pilus assembly protein TadB